MAALTKKLGAWGRLVRLPNLLTAWGDPVAGFALVTALMWAGKGHHMYDGVYYAQGAWDQLHAFTPMLGRLAALAGAAIAFYAMGMVQNDLAHVKRDRATRPDRPIGSGAVAPREAAMGVTFLTLVGMLLAFLAGRSNGGGMAATMGVALALVATITLYNYVAAFNRGLAPVVMGACRALSILLGAAAANPKLLTSLAAARELWPVWVALACVWAYIGLVTFIASRETETRAIGLVRWAPSLVMFVGVELTVLWMLNHSDDVLRHSAWMFLGQGAVLWSMLCGARLSGMCTPATTGKTIGMFIRGQLWIQAMLIATAGVFGGLVAAGVLLGWPINRLLSKRFPPS